MELQCFLRLSDFFYKWHDNTANGYLMHRSSGCHADQCGVSSIVDPFLEVNVKHHALLAQTFINVRFLCNFRKLCRLLHTVERSKWTSGTNNIGADSSLPRSCVSLYSFSHFLSHSFFLIFAFICSTCHVSQVSCPLSLSIIFLWSDIQDNKKLRLSIYTIFQWFYDDPEKLRLWAVYCVQLTTNQYGTSRSQENGL